MKISPKHIIFFLLIALLTLPVIQHGLKIFAIRPLDGDYILTQRPQYTITSWMDGSFQNQFDRYLEDHIGFRPFFVRLYNQMDFTFFKKANAEGIVIGKNNMLYEYDYIRALNGEDFIGKAALDKKLSRFRFLQQHLKTNFDIDLLLILEPSKARTYPDNIPKRYQKAEKSLSNYQYIAERINELEINHLDLNHFFLKVKDTATYPVYPLYGTHWSEYTMSFVADTMMRFLENLRQIDMPEFRVSGVTMSDTLNFGDFDSGRTLNLLCRPHHQPMPYPVFAFENDPSKTRPMVLVVSDSYYWNLFNTRIPQNLFANEAFWYFNAKVYPDFYYSEKWTSSLDLRAEIEKQDIIILSVTERFLYKMDWNFIDQAFGLYAPQYTGDIVYQFENQLRLNAGWFDDVLAKASQQKVPLEEAIRREAYFQAWVQQPETFLTWYGPDHYRSVILGDSLWSAEIRKKATANGIGFEKQLTDDADYVFENEHPELFKLNRLINKYLEAISADEEWLGVISAKAAGFYMPLEEMIKIDAEFMARQEMAANSGMEEKIRYYEQAIKDDPAWLAAITKKAAEQGKSLDQMIREDAIYMAEQENKK